MEKKILKNLPETMYLGGDPEFFFAKKPLIGKKLGRVIGAEKILPEEGIKVNSNRGHNLGENINTSKIIIDGVQAELNPKPFTCRAYNGDEFSELFKTIKKQIGSKKIAINWSVCVKVTPTELASLSPKSRTFGCDPSHNAYNEHIQLPNPATYLFRSAGGHIHIGGAAIKALSLPQSKEVVKILDILVGNTFVMIDRDPGNKERRNAYGRAGEFRKPPHGLEYRVLSNFWIKNYILMSMVYGMTRTAIRYALTPEAAKELKNAVKEEDIRKAINENDFDLAKANFEKIKQIYISWQSQWGFGEGLSRENIEDFEHFIATGGIEEWIKEDPMKHWVQKDFNGHNLQGSERFLHEVIHSHKVRTYGEKAKV